MERKLELTRCRAYKKNDQAWIEQKNGAVVRRLVGYGRLEGVEAAAVLAQLHEVARWYVNFFQLSFKLKSKTREGAKVNQIRDAQRKLVQVEVAGGTEKSTETSQELSRFVASLSTAWRDGEVCPTHRKRFGGPPSWRTRPDPFATTWPMVKQWLHQQPDATAKDLFDRLQANRLEPFQPGPLGTLQRRAREWRSQMAHLLILEETDHPQSAKMCIQWANNVPVLPVPGRTVPSLQLS